jgi:hypothetical protein
MDPPNGELRCLDACACNGEVDCRDWVYQGSRNTEPPVGLIVEAIVRHSEGTLLWHGPTSSTCACQPQQGVA